jgi:hypothetical protein
MILFLWNFLKAKEFTYKNMQEFESELEPEEEEEELEFNIPERLVNKLYELSGDSDKYKGLIIACVTEKGCPMIYSRFDSVITELGLKKATSDYLLKTENDNEMLEE